MKFCGIKVTHDGAVAVIEDGQLILSYESEKIGNRPRYSRFDDLGDIEDLLRPLGYSLGEMDAVAFDGWHKPHKIRRWRGMEVELRLGPYVEGIRSKGLVSAIRGQLLDLDYLTFPHYAGHVGAAYCTSPFAAAGDPALILSWDGLMYPYLYECRGDITKVQTGGALFPLVGNAYPVLAGSFPPFRDRPGGTENLGLAGKIMAYAALGTPDPVTIAKIAAILKEAHTASRAASPVGGDQAFQLEAGVECLEVLAPALHFDGVPPADMIASIDSYFGARLVDGLIRAVRAMPDVPRNLCLTGGTALNINWNRDIRDAGVFDAVWVPPFPNDSGAAIGVACCAMATLEGRSSLDWDVFSGPALREVVHPPGWSRSSCSWPRLARLLHDTGEPVVFLTGRAELGPRALGHRSILAAATDPGMHDRLNDMKGREGYRPIAPVCLEEAAPAIFDPGTADPYMLFNHRVRDDWRTRIPAVCHVDGTARLQTVNRAQCPELVDLLRAYHDVSGVPLLCNTSANFKDCGFFPDVASAMRWGRAPYIWSDGTLYERQRLEIMTEMTRPPVPRHPQDQAPRALWAFDMGLPDLALFPRAELAQLVGKTLAEPEAPLLYGGPGRVEIARGHHGLRAVLAERTDIPLSGASPLDSVMLTSGAAQAIEFVYRAVLDRGDVVAVEAPTWGAAIRMARMLGAEPVAIPMDRHGLSIEALERELARVRAEERRLRLVYTIATYHTPTGWSLSPDRRRRLTELAREHDFLIIEDRVYAELRYDGPQLPPLASFPDGDRVVTVGSVSKTLAPALRLGWLTAEPALVDTLARRREDLGSSQLMARVLESFIHTGGYDEHVARVNRIYRGKRDTASEALCTFCGDAAHFDRPDGGMFFWIQLAAGIDGAQVMEYAREEGVICRPGEAFFGDDGNYQQWFRMAFTMVPEEELVRGVRVLGDAVHRSRRQTQVLRSAIPCQEEIECFANQGSGFPRPVMRDQ